MKNLWLSSFFTSAGESQNYVSRSTIDLGELQRCCITPHLHGREKRTVLVGSAHVWRVISDPAYDDRHTGVKNRQHQAAFQHKASTQDILRVAEGVFPPLGLVGVEAVVLHIWNTTPGLLHHPPGFGVQATRLL